jgi:hypothetical protein
MPISITVATDIEFQDFDSIPDAMMEFIEEVRDEQRQELLDRITEYVQKHHASREDDYDRAMTIL